MNEIPDKKMLFKNGHRMTFMATALCAKWMSSVQYENNQDMCLTRKIFFTLFCIIADGCQISFCMTVYYIATKWGFF